MDNFKWTIGHIVKWLALYGAFVANLEGVMHIVKFTIWTVAVISIGMLSDSYLKKAALRPPIPRVRNYLYLFQAWTAMALLVWFGHLMTALAWGWAMAVGYASDRAAETIRRTNDKVDA